VIPTGGRRAGRVWQHEAWGGTSVEEDHVDPSELDNVPSARDASAARGAYRKRNSVRLDPVTLALLLLLVAAGVAAVSVRSIWLKVVPAAIALGPITYGALGFALADLAPPGRIHFLSLPLHWKYLELNIALWIVLWGVGLAWWWKRRTSKGGH